MESTRQLQPEAQRSETEIPPQQYLLREAGAQQPRFHMGTRREHVITA